MTVFARPPEALTCAACPVMLATCSDELPSIQELWSWFETLVGLRGRKMYGTVDVLAGTYATCTPVRPDDDPEALGPHVGELPGGPFRRGLLVGEPPARGVLQAPRSGRAVAAGATTARPHVG